MIDIDEWLETRDNVVILHSKSEVDAAKARARKDYAERWEQAFGFPCPTPLLNRWWPSGKR